MSHYRSGLRADSRSAIIDAIRACRFCWSTEDELQQGVAAALEAAGYIAAREVRLNAHDRIDLVVGRIGIEVKTAGTWRDVRRQLERYARSGRFDTLVLVTTRPTHRRIGADIAGIPFHVHLAGAAL